MHRYQQGAENAEREDAERKGVPREERGKGREGREGKGACREEGMQRGKHADREA